MIKTFWTSFTLDVRAISRIVDTWPTFCTVLNNHHTFWTDFTDLFWNTFTTAFSVINESHMFRTSFTNFVWTVIRIINT
jgi:hypothetical protein